MRPYLLYIPLIAGLLACASPARADESPPAHLLLGAGWGVAQTRDAHISPRRLDGSAWALALGYDVWREDRIDSVRAGYASGAQAATLEPLAWSRYAVSWTIQPRVWQAGRGALYVGGAWVTDAQLRVGELLRTWQGRSTLDVAATWRHELSGGRTRWLVDAGVTAALLGVAGRPARANVIEGASLGFGDLHLAAPHTLQAGELVVGSTWLTAWSGDVRLAYHMHLSRFARPQPATTLGHELRVLWMIRI